MTDIQVKKYHVTSNYKTKNIRLQRIYCPAFNQIKK